MFEQLKQLDDLEVELHDANQEFVRAAQPLYRLRDLNAEQRRQVGAELRTALARWESATQQISHVLGNPATPDMPHAMKAYSDETH